MTQLVEHERLRRIGLTLAVVGVILVALALIFPSDRADADTHVFDGACAGVENSGICVLDEPEGNDPAVHGLVTYLRTPSTMSFTIDAVDVVREVQICMQTSAPFAEGANVCAGSHGNHVAWHQVANIYTVNLVAEGLEASNPLYWTLHVVAGGRTLQVIGQCGPPPSTTTTTVAPTTTTIVPATTTTIPGTTTTVTGATTTTIPGTTTTAVPGTTTTIVPGTTTLGATTTTTLPIDVAGKSLSRTGGPSYWALLIGAALMLIGVTLVAATRLLETRE